MIAPQPFFRARGTPFSILHRIRALLEAGHSVDLVTYPFGEDMNLPGLRILRSHRPPFIRDVKIGPSLAKLILDIPLYVGAARALRERRYDVLHSHEEAAFFAMRLARQHGLRHVYDMHSSLPHQLRNFQAYELGPVRQIFRLLEKRVLQTCDGVITICSELADIVREESPSIPHAMIENTADDTKVFGRKATDVRAELDLRDKRIILYTGTFEPYQGIDILLRGFARILRDKRDAHLLMVGGQREQVDRYVRIAQSLGLGAAVTFTGSIHPSRIPAFIEAADLIVSPRSHGRYTPLKIYNYMRSQRPLVATDLPTHTQTLDANVALLVPPTDEGLASGIAHILENPALGKQLADAAAMRAEKRFSDAAYIAKVSRFYEDVIKTNAQKRDDVSIPAQR
jgi:glycosyltransferase involved in cell wall biosynthesis